MSEQQDLPTPKEGVTIPYWALWLTVTFKASILAWGSWVTGMLYQAAPARDLHAAEIRLEVLEQTRVTPMDIRHATAGSDARLDRIESKIDALQREFDRSLVRPKEGS